MAWDFNLLDGGGSLLGDGGGFGGSLALPDYSDLGVPSYEQPLSSPSVFGQITDFGADLLTGYLDLQGDRILLQEQTKLAGAQQQQANLLGTVEQPQNTNAYTYTPEQLMALAGTGSGGGGNNNNMLLILGAAAVVYLVIK